MVAPLKSNSEPTTDTCTHYIQYDKGAFTLDQHDTLVAITLLKCAIQFLEKTGCEDKLVHISSNCDGPKTEIFKRV